MPHDLLSTKLIPPQPRADFVARPRLVQRIANPKRGRVTLITASAGYGKTTLLAEWRSSYKGQLAWLSLDAADNDPALFWSYIAAALGVKRAAAWDGGALVNALVLAPARCTLVLDDLHVLQSKLVLQELGYFIEHAPQTLGVILAARTEPQLPLARWRARGELNQLRARDLAFTVPETRAFLQQTMQSGMSEEAMARLGKVSEGWAAALQLVALAMQNREQTQDWEVARGHIFEYLGSEVLAQQSRTCQRFLVETSILERVNPDVAGAVTGRRDSEAQLEALVRANLFISTFGGQEAWYRYHPLFAEFLQKRLRQRDAEAKRSLHDRAAQWFAQHKLYAEAIEHALLACDFENASTWIDVACEAAMQRGQLATMLNWLDALPPEVVAANPSLNLWYGWVLCLEHRFEEMDAHLRAAVKRAGQLERGDPCWREQLDIVRGKVAAIRAQAAVLQNDEKGTLKWSRVTLELLPERFRRERAVAWLNRAKALARCCRAARAIEAFEQATLSSNGADHPFIRLNVLYEHARFLWKRGETEAAQTLLRRALALAQKEDVIELAAPAQELLDKILTGRNAAEATLSAREREILHWLARGESNPQIAARIGIGVGTVNWHTKNIYKKLGVRNRTEAARFMGNGAYD